ncbi:hypothetical protein BX600DRAFT_306325 [Xylariales sp. PMI_506]|nr:hypothetical protein BX600DRAFT_306325 [Xylariales sp. PMI_506]
MWNIRSRPLLLVTIWMFANQALCGQIAAWWATDAGPALMMQDDKTGNIRYSLCNSNNTPIFPQDTTITIPLESYLPKNGTNLAGTGYFDNTNIWASIFYQDDSDQIINSLLKCDDSTGYWENTGEYVVSGAAPSVASGTGLAAILLSATDGYRVFFHDDDMALRDLVYSPSTTKWTSGFVSQDAGLGNAIATEFSNSNNITVVTPKDNANFEVARWNTDESWHISAFPRALDSNATLNETAPASSFILNSTVSTNFTLPAWDGNPGGLGLTIDAAHTRSIFYIGTDSKLYQVANFGYSWRLYASQAATYWPIADTVKASLGVASDFDTSQLRVYYISGGEMMQLIGDNNVWQAAAALPNANSTRTTSGTSGTASSSSTNTSAANTSSPAADGGLSAGGKAGVGVGVAVGVVAIGGVIGALFFLRRRQQRMDAAGGLARGAGAGGSQTTPATGYSDLGSSYDSHPAAVGSSYGSPTSGYGLQSAAAWNSFGGAQEKPPGELDPTTGQIHEMAVNHETYELMGEGHYQEAPTVVHR